jgi:PAT family beta-lactamase induction signal transducer AmpG
VALVSIGLLDGFFLATMPLIATDIAGWTDAEYSALSGTGNLLAGVLGVFVFGFLADKLGTRPATMLGFCLLGTGIAFYLMRQLAWSSAIMVQAATLGFLSLFTLTSIAICASAMKVCSLKVAATQFTLFMAISNLGITLASAAFGLVTALGGYPAVLAVMIVIAGIGAGAMYLFNEARLKQRVLDEIDGAVAAF